MAWLGGTFLLLIALGVSWHIHPEAPGLLIVLVMFGPLFFAGLGLMLKPKNGIVLQIFGLLLMGATAWVLLWGLSLVIG